MGRGEDGGQTLCCLEISLWDTFVLSPLAPSDAHESLTLWHSVSDGGGHLLTSLAITAGEK